MHIKQIIIKGFKTYREQVIVGPLSAKDNVVVGHNGHGKSNFFSAIMFVLSDKFSNIRAEEKQRLIHEGAEAQDLASVEIILDNSDSRLPIEKSTVSIKRILEDKKDEFYIDGKHVTKGDINNLLESAGFSKSNPYYVVQQGRVASLAGMNESQCLELLKEVAGTTVYDERKEESDRLIEDTKRKIEKINENRERMKEKVEELQGESSELQEYTKLEKERRAIEYILYKNHVVGAQEQIDVIENQHSDLLEKIHNLKLTQNSIQDEIDKFQDIIDTKTAVEGKIKSFLVNLGEELGKLQSQKIQIESKLGVYRERRKKNGKDLEMQNIELRELREEMKRNDRELYDLKPAFKNITDQELRINEQMAAKQKRIDQLNVKQGSAAKFKTLKERNKFLNSEIKKLENLKQENTQQVAFFNAEIAANQSKLAEIASKIPSITAKILEEKQQYESFSSNYISLKQARAENSTNLASLRHEEEKLLSTIEQSESKSISNSQRLKILLPGSLFSTLERLKSECSSLPGFYGLLIDLIEIPNKFQTCSDIVGKFKVFSVVVESYSVAKQVLDINSRISGDFINIYCLEWVNELPAKNREYPSGNDSISLIKQIKVKEHVKTNILPLLHLVFGKCLLVRNNDIASRYAKEFKLHCITPDGQMVRSGAYIMRAGMHDAKRERIRTYFEYYSSKNELSAYQLKLNTLLKQKESLLSNDFTLQKSIQQSLSLKESSSHKLQDLKGTETILRSTRHEINNKINELEQAKLNYERTLKEIESKLTEYYHGLKNTELGDLTSAESQELENLIKETQDIEKSYRQVQLKKNEAFRKIQDLEQSLNVLLPEKERKLEELISDCTVALESKDELELEEDNRHISKLIESCESDISRYNEELSEGKISIRNALEDNKHRLDNINRIKQEVTEMSTESDKIMQKLLNLMETKESYIKKMGSLGPLPGDEHDRLKSEPPELLKKLLEHNSKKIKKYQHVNKRALEQYNKYIEKLESLNEKISDLEKSELAIQDLILHLDSVKDDAIVRTFRSVAQHFSEVFHEIVPQGKGRLKMVKGEGTGVDKYVGVSISVSFSRSEATEYKMQQLSGGQKTAVAIALIIAIQRADPAPFYLFDELDAALDSQLRNSLASVISRSSERAQFIMTTFKPELCQNASKLFEVKFKNKASTIKQTDKARALEVIQQINNSN